MEGKPKASKALIITIILVAILAVIIFSIFRNKNNPVGTKTAIDTNEKVFESLFGTSKSKDVEVVDSLNSGKNTLTINAEAGEDIKKGDLLYLVGYNKNGDPIVKKIAGKINDPSKIFGIAMEDIKKGLIGKILIPDLYGNSNQTLWKKIMRAITKTTNNISDWVSSVFRDGGGSNVPTYECKKDGVEIDCDNVPNVPDGSTYVCKKDGVVINCGNLPSNINHPFFECKRDGIVIDCGSVPSVPDGFTYVCKKNGVTINCNNIADIINPPVFECKKDGAVVDCSSIGVLQCKQNGVDVGCGTVPNIPDISFECKQNGAVVDCSSIYNFECKKDGVITDCSNLFNLPTVTVTATPTSIAINESSTISWTSTNATTCDSGNGTNTAGLTGSFSTGPLSTSMAYSITCTGANGSMSGWVFVSVGAGATGDISLFPIVVVTAEPVSISAGESSIISWTSTNATTCDDGDGTNTAGLTGSFDTGPLDISTSYTITCTGVNGTMAGNTFVSVSSGPDGISYQCSDGLDNDSDGKIDADDSSCHTDFDATNPNSYDPTTPFEGDAYIPECSDGLDNDNDGLIDSADPQCYTNGIYDPTVFFEAGSISFQCNDGLDNDSDGLIDVADPGCHTDLDATNPDTFIEFLNDENMDNTTTPPVTQCSDGLDNDSDGFIDVLDPSCHTDFDATTPSSYSALLDNEYLDYTPTEEENSCKILEDNPLKFTEAEQAELDALLRKFYLLAGTLKTEDDISLAYNDIATNKELVSNVKQLTNECYAQSVPKDSTTPVPGYKGPTIRHGNPWYRPTDRGTYITNAILNANDNILKSGDLYDKTYDINDNEIIVPSKSIFDFIKNNFTFYGYKKEFFENYLQNEYKNASYWDFEALFNIW